jgi:hypothetical protein
LRLPVGFIVVASVGAAAEMTTAFGAGRHHFDPPVEGRAWRVVHWRHGSCGHAIFGLTLFLLPPAAPT